MQRGEPLDRRIDRNLCDLLSMVADAVDNVEGFVLPDIEKNIPTKDGRNITVTLSIEPVKE